MPIRTATTYRLFLCMRCRRQVSICATCDRGQWYCGRGCSQQCRREKLRAAGKRHQLSPQGREKHAERQATYRAARRQRERLVLEEVRYQGVLAPRASALQTASEPACLPLSLGPYPRSRVPTFVVCTLCGTRCEPYARFDSLRVLPSVRFRRKTSVRSASVGVGSRGRRGRVAVAGSRG
jgi:hypothetical protein